MLPMDTLISVEDSHVDVLHEITERLSTADGFHDVLNRVVDFGEVRFLPHLRSRRR
jgi:hypothetical protein